MNRLTEQLWISALLLCLLLTPFISQGQIGGRYSFVASALPTNARVTAMGGSVINIRDTDVALAQMNPALIDSIMHNQLSFNHSFHFAGVSHGNLAYGRYLKKWRLASHAAIQYVNYGDFDQTDEFGNISGEFSAGEVAIIAGVSKQLNERIHVGANFKILTGSYESYNNFGIGVDLGLHYEKNALTSWALVLKNVGSELVGLVDSRNPLPLDLQLGFSKKLEHLPFRFSIIGHHLHEPYIRYDDPATDITVDISGETTVKSNFSKNIDNLFRHLIFNGEFLIGKREQVRLRLGYDHLRKREMKVESNCNQCGFSMGVGFNIKAIKLDYGISNYHLAGATNHLSMRYDIGKIFTKI